MTWLEELKLGYNKVHYIKTLWMNVISAVFWLVLYLSLIINQAYSSEIEANSNLFFTVLTISHVSLVTIFSFTGYTIYRRLLSITRSSQFAQMLNYSLLLAVLVEYVYIYSIPYDLNGLRVMILLLLETILVVVPVIVNLKYLKIPF